MTRTSREQQHEIIFHRLTGHGENHRELFGSEFTRMTAALLIRENLLDGTSEIGWFFETFHQREPFKLLLPAPSPSPAPHSIVSQTNDVFDLGIEPSFKTEQNNLSTLSQLKRYRDRSTHRQQNVALPLRDDHLGCLAWHEKPPCPS